MKVSGGFQLRLLEEARIHYWMVLWGAAEGLVYLRCSNCSYESGWVGATGAPVRQPCPRCNSARQLHEHGKIEGML